MTGLNSQPKPWLYANRPLSIYRKKEWFREVQIYLRRRYPSILNRLINLFRFVELDPTNACCFSYELASLLRDIGGTLSSVLDCIVKGHRKLPKDKILNIGDYRNFLNNEIKNIENVVVILNVDFKEKSVFPFEGFSGKKIDSNWWSAYNDVKHLEIYSIKKGCLSNIIYSFCALSVLYDCIKSGARIGSEVDSELIADIMDYRSHFEVIDEQDHYDKELLKETEIFPKCEAFT
jgi:hypothetical protein